MPLAPPVLFRNGTVWTGVVRGTRVVTSDALLVGEGMVLATGGSAVALAGELGAETVDLAGGTVVPGFGDGHAHPVFAGVETLFAPVRDLASVEDVVGAVAAWAAEHPDAAWVRGEGYDPTLAPGGRFDAAWLDAVVPDRPVVLRASDYHTAWVNTRALELAGIDAATPDPADGEIVRRDDGTPLGTLREWGAWRRAYALLPPLTDEERVGAVAHAARTYARHGVTWVQDAWVEADTLESWLLAAHEDVLTLHANLAFLAEPAGRWEAERRTLVQQRTRVQHEGGRLLTARTVKFFVDGVIESGTAALLSPYTDCPHSHGIANWQPDELAEAVTAIVGLGFQPHLHAIGDAGVRSALDAVRAAVAVHGEANRPVIAHAQLVDAADLDRFRELGVVANFEPLWAQPDPSQVELTVPRLGPERADAQYRMATLLRSGTAVSFGSDWPVTSPDPLAGIAVAVTRQTPQGDPPGGWMPAERLTLDEALLAATAGVAHQAGEETLWGRLVPGMRADVAWLAAPIAELDPRALHEVTVAGTWLGGVRVHG